MYQILTLNKISSSGLANFDSGKFACSDTVENPDAVIVRSASMLEYEFPGNLLSIARAGAGYNNIPVDRCTENGICVFNTPGANANAVKELVIAALFMASRKIAEATDWCKTLKGSGAEVSKKVEKGKSSFAGPEILGKTLGVVGLGAIGLNVANTAAALGMKVAGYDPFLSEAAKSKLADGIKVADTLDEIYAAADYITLHVPLNDGTRSMICADTLAKCRDGVRILNFARGELVADTDIVAALESGKCAAYVTDFPTDGQIGVPGVTAIPHLGASTPEAEENCAVMAVNQTQDYLLNGNVRNSVNLPALSLERSGSSRVCIIACADVSEKTGAVLGRCTVTGSASAERKGIFYSLTDTADKIDDETIEELKAIEEIKAVRII